MKIYSILLLLLARWSLHVVAFSPSASSSDRVSPRTSDGNKVKIKKDISDTSDDQSMNRRELFSNAVKTSVALGFLSVNPASAESSPTRLSASWSATSGLNSLDPNDPNFVSFDPSAYAAMRDDPSRTPVFKKALQARLNSSPPETQIVLDLGTGPFALFAIMAAELGAKKVYAIEANPAVADFARQTIRKQGWDDVIEVLDGFSTDITPPEKADIIVAEIVGSIASEEGAYATILDAHTRLIKDPKNANNWIPNRIQTWAAPASYTLHNLFKPPEFDWTKIAAEPVRFNCRDLGLALLDDPQCVEDISFSQIQATKPSTSTKLSFRASPKRMQETEEIFAGEYRKGRLPKSDAAILAQTAAHSCTGIAFWPRLFLPGDQEIASRSHPEGGHQRSHWQSVLPIMGAIPCTGLQGGDAIDVTCQFDTPASVTAVPKYSVVADVYASNA